MTNPHVLTMSPVDALWVLVAGALVFTMQAGFLCVEAGLSRAKHSMNVAVKNVTDYLFASVAFLLVGYGLMFGRTWHGVVGTSDFLLGWSYPGQPVFFFFQLVFCGCAATIVSGAVAERMRFKAYIVYSIVVSTLFYPLFGHWAWGGSFYLDQQGWLAKLGYLDFAGSSVVHQMGGWMALAGIVVLGPRLGKFDAHGRPQRIIGHNIPLALLGVFILWFGWLGFNGGSVLAMTEAVGVTVVNTNTAAAIGSIVAMTIGWCYRRRPDIVDIGNGALGGLVAITASARYVGSSAALLIGAVAGVVVVVAAEWLERGLKLDDVVGAVPVHGFCGLWGILAAGLFARPEFLLYPEHRLYHIGIQALGSAACFTVAFGGGYLFFRVLDRLMGIRVSPEAEVQGLNVSEHGATSPLLELAETMRTIAQTKDWSRRTAIDPYSDAGGLGDHFNQLLDTTQSTVEALHGKTQALEKAYDRLQKTQAELVQAEKLSTVGRFAAGLAHEVKNPLGIILSGIEFLGRRFLRTDPGVRDDLRLITEAVHRADTIVKGVLRFARPSELKTEQVRPHMLVQEAVAFLKYRAPLQNVTIRTDAPDQNLWVAVDKNQMQQVFFNLLLNAVEAMPQGGTLTVRLFKEMGWCVLAVQDTGIGIAPEALPKIFEPFFTTKRDSKGTGLGLSVAKRIVEDHGGVLRVESQPGQGTTFQVRLPLIHQGAPAGAMVDRADRQPLQVLLIEDDAVDAQALGAMLVEDGAGPFQVECIERLHPGLERLRRGGIDVVVLDLGLPDSQGLETFTALHRHAPEVPVVIVTDLADERLACEALLQGAQEYVVKSQLAGKMLAHILRYAVSRARPMRRAA